MNVTKKKTPIHRWQPFEEARAYVQRIGLKDWLEWQAWAKSAARPNDIPSAPREVYKAKGWVSLGDWLGTGRISYRKIVYRPFDEARTFVRRLGLKNYSEWRTWVKSSEYPNDIPTFANKFYKDKGWMGWHDWLGSVRIYKKKVFRPFDEAREYVKSLGLKNWHEWQAWAKSAARPVDIPSAPRKIYKGKGWVSLGDWLGTGRISYRKKVYRPFDEARTFVRRFGLKNRSEWRAWVKSSECPDDIPAGAHRTYQDKGWAGWGDWLGTGRIRMNRYENRSFEEARDCVRSLGFKNSSDWREWSKSGLRPNDIPSTPGSFYKGKGWVSMGDWLGTGRIACSKRVYLPFAEACEFVMNLGLNNVREWQGWAKSTQRPDAIPMTPHCVYRGKGWIGYGDWLGTERVGRPRKKGREDKSE